MRSRCIYLFAACLWLGVSFAFAHGGATGIVKERMDLMGSIGQSMKTLVAMFKGERDYDVETVKAAAASIRDHSGARMTRLFPENSLDKPTETLPTVWEQWEEFNTFAESLAAYSDALVKAAGNPRGPDKDGRDANGGTGADAEALAAMAPDAAFKRMAKTCLGCHGKFRAKKD